MVNWIWLVVTAVGALVMGMVTMCVIVSGAETERQRELAEAKRKAAAYKRLWEKEKCRI
jgi:uncharacterized membrane protein YesL